MPRCPHLNGHCIHTGDHSDHDGPVYRTVLPGADGPAPVALLLEHLEDLPPHVALYLGREIVELTNSAATVRAALVLAGLAVRLLRLAAQFRTTR
jgi:hypothetical protein